MTATERHFQNRSDCHSHSQHSPDGKHSVADMYQQANEAGLLYYAVTDHCECHDFKGEARGFDYQSATVKGFAALQAQSQTGTTQLLKGLELGQPMQNLAAAEAVLSAHPYDFVLGSVHNIRNHEDFYYLKYDKMTPAYLEALLQAYFAELHEMLLWGRIDSVAHLTYPLRYIVGKHAIRADLTAHEAAIDSIYDCMIQKEIALEINTSGLRQELGETLPGRKLVSQYYEKGGRLVTLGSDAHTREDIGKGINAAMQLLRQVGFREYTVFKQHAPIMVPIA